MKIIEALKPLTPALALVALVLPAGVSAQQPQIDLFPSTAMEDLREAMEHLREAAEHLREATECLRKVMEIAEDFETDMMPAITALQNEMAEYDKLNCRGAVSDERAVGEVFRDALKDGGQGPQMVVLPTGSFRMGSPDGEADRYSDEGPLHTVNISKRIAMGRYEVTFADYDRFADADSRRTRPADRGWCRGRQPVINVSQEDAKAYATWLSAQTGRTYRLPSESEWEYAARSGTRTRYSWGDEIGVNRANCDGCGSEWDDEQTAPVGSFEPNAFGLFDMHGNVWEWMEDCWHDNYEGAPTDGRALTSGCGSDVRAIVRGGSWVDYPRTLRSAHRYRDTPSGRTFLVGFRLVQDLNP